MPGRNMGASAEPTGLAGAEALEPSGLHPSGGIPRAAHTPLPWGISYGYGLETEKSARYVAGPSEKQIGIKLASPYIEGAWDDDPEAHANAEFIVRACNNHYELIDALEQFAKLARLPTSVTRSTKVEAPAHVYHRALAALAKARGQ